MNQDNREYSQLNTHLLLCLKAWLAHCIPRKIKLHVLCVNTDNIEQQGDDEMIYLSLICGGGAYDI